MSRHCVLCQRELSPDEAGTVAIGDKRLPSCPACKRHYDHSTGVERQRLELRAQLYWDSIPAEQQKLELQAQPYWDSLPEEEEVSPAPSCPVCGTAMELRLSGLSIGSDGMSVLSVLTAQQCTVDLYACPKCGKVELYTAGFQSTGA